MNLPIDIIFVPKGAEYKAVCRGLKQTSSQSFVVPIPIGFEPVNQFFKKAENQYLFTQKPSKILLMGLCGSLSSQYNLGDVVIYQDCIYRRNESTTLLKKRTDFLLTNLLKDKLQEGASLVRSLTSDRLIWSGVEKRQLSQLYHTEVVDMEGYATLQFLNPRGISVAMVRVISDNCDQDIPNLNNAINTEGNLQTLPLIKGMLQQPLAATRLIRGSLKGLKILEKITTFLFSNNG